MLQLQEKKLEFERVLFYSIIKMTVVQLLTVNDDGILLILSMPTLIHTLASEHLVVCVLGQEQTHYGRVVLQVLGRRFQVLKVQGS